jgi:hypothetical protein
MECRTRCRFGKDERLTEDYAEDIWADGYGGHS